MTSFTSSSNSSEFTSQLLFSSLPQLECRGGACIASTSEIVVIFGGANREQKHFNDLWVCERCEPQKWREVSASGDVPPARSGASMCSFAPHILMLFGGINFEEEAVYNDLYTLNTLTWEWKYVGEAGAHIEARNSHTLNILPIVAAPNSISRAVDSGDRGAPAPASFPHEHRALVLVGGASPELGPLEQNYFAILQNTPTDLTDFFVTWKACASANAPCGREMHASVVIGDCLFVLGGRSCCGELLNDVWCCRIERDDISGNSGAHWHLRSDLTLPMGMCAFEAAAGTDGSIVIIGGFTASGISDIIYSSSINTDAAGWMAVSLSLESFALRGRFGHAVCQAPDWLLVPSSTADSITTAGAGLLMFGGVDVERDYGDCWMLKTK